MDGFKNYSTATFNTTIAGQTLAAGHFVSATVSTPLDNTNSISQVLVQYGGVSSNTYLLNGIIANNFAAGSYQIESLYYFDSTNLNVFTVVVNETAGNVTIPTITINCRGFLFLAPF